MMGAVANSNAAVGSKVLRLIGGGSVEPLRMAAGFVQCRLLSLRAWHVQHQQRRRSVTSTALGAQLGAQEALDGEAAAAAAAPLLRPHQAAAQGSIELFVGPMFAGKTSALLQRVAQYESAGLRVAVVKSNKDNRYDAAHVVTHDGCRKPCFAVPTLAAFREAAGAAYEGFQVIAVDEAQFFPDLREFSLHAADLEHKHIVLAGLDGDFQRQRFGQVLDMLPVVDSVTKLHATCKFCEQEAQPLSKAVFSLRISADNRQEVVGGADKYAPVCRRHYVHLSGLRQVVAVAEEQDGSSGNGNAAGQVV